MMREALEQIAAACATGAARKDRLATIELCYGVAGRALKGGDGGYQDGWNDAIAAACERVRTHKIDWLSDKAFGQMERDLHDAVAALRKPTPESVSAQVDRDADNARLHTRLLRHLAQAVKLQNRFLITGWRRALRTSGFDDVVC